MIGIFIIAGLILFVALLLFFPVKIRFFFVGAKKKGLIEIRFFNWKIFSSQDKDESEDADESPLEDDVNSNGETPEEMGAEVEEVISTSSSAGLTKEDMATSIDDEPDGVAFEDKDIVPELETVALDDIVKFDDVEPDAEPEMSSQKKKRVLSEKEFLTLMFNPKLNAMVLRMAWRLLKRAWQLFTIRFEHTVVQGIRMEYDEMGSASAIAALLSSQVRFFESWDFQMDWLKEKELEIKGSVLVRFRLFFLMVWSLMALVFAARVYWWYRKNKKIFIKNSSMFRLVFWRRKIVDLLAAED
ncbi:MAG TPA: hypothetical protein GX724_03795 [Fibrobacter sp.]|nr:hypothetical protein [Fibrobacter sp.]